MFFLLLPTLECNLRCDYCFEKHPQGRWSIQTAHDIIAKILNFLSDSDVRVCKFHWQGGEPLLLGIEFWNNVLDFSETMANEKGITLTQSMQTNLTRYNHEYAPLVRQYFSGVLGSSFELMSTRCMNNGDIHAFENRWLNAYNEALSDGLTIGVLSLINQHTLDMGAVACLDKIRDNFHINKIRFTLPFKQGNDNGYWLDAQQTGEFLVDAYHYWSTQGGNDWIEIRPFKYLQSRFSGELTDESGLCVFANNCTDIALTMMTNGDVSLCDNFAHPDCDVRFGNILDQSMNEIYYSVSRSKIRQQVSGLVDNECASCRYLGFCFGGCFVRAQKSKETSNYHDHYCQSYKCLFEVVDNLG